MKKPEILKNDSTKEIQESGCCFTSCGGSPVNQCVADNKNQEKETLKKIKNI